MSLVEKLDKLHQSNIPNFAIYSALTTMKISSIYNMGLAAWTRVLPPSRKMSKQLEIGYH